MWVIALEALVALAMLLIIVWLTMGGARRRDAQKDEAQARKADPDHRAEP
jgi:hypothetical protein